VSDAAIAPAQSVLTPSQLAALKQVQANEAAQLLLAPPPPAAAVPMTAIMLSYH
jgi:hypothetical protein